MTTYHEYTEHEARRERNEDDMERHRAEASATAIDERLRIVRLRAALRYIADDSMEHSRGSAALLLIQLERLQGVARRALLELGNEEADG